MRRADYRDAIDWVAQNDSPADKDALDPEAVSMLVTAVLISDIFNVPSNMVGADIVKRRQELKS